MDTVDIVRKATTGGAVDWDERRDKSLLNCVRGAVWLAALFLVLEWMVR